MTGLFLTNKTRNATLSCESSLVRSCWRENRVVKVDQRKVRGKVRVDYLGLKGGSWYDLGSRDLAPKGSYVEKHHPKAGVEQEGDEGGGGEEGEQLAGAGEDGEGGTPTQGHR